MNKPKYTTLVLFVAIALLSQGVLGQNRRPSIVSPEVHPDKTVTFRLYMPDARKVVVSTQFESEDQAMTKDTSGVWSVTLGPVQPDIYPYSFVVDGVRIMDPNNPLYFPNEHFKNSLVDIPGDTPLVHSLQDVPHGIVSYRYYHSKTLNTIRPLVIYTPPGYEKNRSEKYPVLYLIHGMTDTEETWFKVGHANLILDNLIAQGKAEPMIIVMPYANTYSYGGRVVDREEILQTDLFNQDMLLDIIPFVERNYRTLTDKAHRAIAGFSLGGRQTLAVGLGNPELFDWVCAYSPAIWPNEFENDFENVYASPEKINQLKLFSLSCGTEDGLYKSSQAFDAALKEKNIEPQTFFPPGGHSWMNCKLYLTKSAQVLFR